jgi:hypothetical protein
MPKDNVKTQSAGSDWHIQKGKEKYEIIKQKCK